MQPQPEPSESVRSIVVAMVGNALAHCDRSGIAHEDFYKAMVEERKTRGMGGPGGLANLLERTFHRLTQADN